MRRREFFAVLASAGLTACTRPPVVAARPRGPRLWLARRKSSRVFLLGVAEATDRSWWSAPVDRAFADARELWLETPPPPRPGSDEARAREALVDELGHQKGRGFYDALAPGVRVRAQAYVAELGIDPAEIEPTRPWLAYYTLNGAFWRTYKPPQEIEYPDAVFRTRAQRAGKALRYEFPTQELLLRWFAAMPDDAQSQYIAMLLDFFDDQKRGFNDACGGWVRGEPCTRVIDRMRRATPALYDVLQRQRNAWWAQQVDQLLAGGGTQLAVIGMNHLLGPDGIPPQLARIGIATVDDGA